MKNNLVNYFDSIPQDIDPSLNNNPDYIAETNDDNFEIPISPIKQPQNKSNYVLEHASEITSSESYPSSEPVDLLQNKAKELMLQIKLYEQKLLRDSNNPRTLYSLIDLYTQSNQKDKLEKILRETLSSYPLTEKMWLDWIKEKRSQCLTLKDQYSLIEMYKIALSDFPYFKVCKKYLKFLIELNKEKDEFKEINEEKRITIDYIREEFNKILPILGLDLDYTSQFYDLYQQFEIENNITKEKLRDLWRKRLSIPSVGLDTIMHDYEKWEKSLSNNTYEINRKDTLMIYNKTTSIIDKIIGFNTKFEVFIKDIESSNNLYDLLDKELPSLMKINPNYVILYFEKALQKKSNVFLLWQKYHTILSKFPDRSLKLGALKRACRCCYGDIMFIVLYLREMEINDLPHKDIKNKIRESFLISEVPSFQCELWKLFLEFKCRYFNESKRIKSLPKIRELFKLAIEDIEEQEEYINNLYHIWAEFECYKAKDAIMLCDIMNHIVIKDPSMHNWRAYLYYIKSVGTPQMAREIYKRAFLSLESIAEKDLLRRNWLSWEKISGTAKTIDASLQYTMEILSKMENDKNKQQTSQSNVMSQDNNNNNSIEEDKKSIDEDRNNKKIIVKNIPLTYDENQLKNFILTISPLCEMIDIRVIRDNNGVSRSFAFIDMPSNDAALTLVNQLNNKKIEDDYTITCAISKPPKEGESDFRTLFVNNISFNTTKDSLKNVFSKYGNVLDVRIIMNQQTGKPRGYCYIEYQHEDSIKSALNDNEPIYLDKRRLQVKQSESSSKIRNQIKYIAFISNLHFKQKESEIEDFIIKKGEIEKESIVKIAISKDDTGKSKGFGFVEFDTIQNLNKAIGLNGKTMKGRPIIIKESNRKTTTPQNHISSKVSNNDNDNSDQEEFLKVKRKRSDGKSSKETDKPKMSNKDFKNLFN